MDYQAFYDNHLVLLANKDADALVENDYHDEAEMILLVAEEPIYIKGKEALKKQLGLPIASEKVHGRGTVYKLDAV